MTLRALLQFRNLDSTSDINTRYVNLIGPGVYHGGQVTPVPAQLAVSLAPWQLVNVDGMVAEETSDTVILQCPAGQTTVIAVYAVYVENGAPILQTVAYERDAFYLLPDLEHYVIMAMVTVPIGATSILSSYISYEYRQSIDPLGRSPFRGFTNATPTDTVDNQVGDFYIVVTGGVANLWAWTGTQWQVMTDFVALSAELANHIANLDVNVKHITDNELAAVVGTSGVEASAVIQDITYSAAAVGVAGNLISIAYTSGGVAGSELVTVTGNAISVKIADGVSTALQIKTAIDNSPAADLVTDQITGIGSNPQYTTAAVLLTDGAGEPVSAANKLVDNADPRIPLLNEAQALPGSNGIPGPDNLYITQDYPLAIPEEQAFVLPLAQFPPLAVSPQAVYLTVSDGPIYVGLSSIGSANIYFRFYDPSDNREFTTASELTVNCTGVYKDANLTIELDPSTDSNVDEYGFFNNAGLYIKFSTLPDTNFRLIYGQGFTLGSLPNGALLRRNIYDAQTTGETVIAIEQIKGRPYTTEPPTDEQNINLRSSQVQLQEYMATVFNADHVVSNFANAASVPDFGTDFVENVGIPTGATFTNTNLVGFTYNSTTGVVTYNSSVDLSAVTAGNIFLDGAGNAFTIQSAPSGFSLTIRTRDGYIPQSSTQNPLGGVNTSVTTALNGSCQPDNNPRNINLSTLQYVSGRERINIRNISVAPNEYHPITNNVAYQIITPVRSENFGEPRVRLYGGLEVINTGRLQRVIAAGSSRMLVTGFFTELYLLCDFTSPLQTSLPSVTVKVDGSLTGTTVDLSRSGTEINFITMQSLPGIRAKSVAMVNGLSDGVPHTVEIVVAAGSSMVCYGFDLIRYAVTSGLVIPGRAFVQADLYKNDIVQTLLTPAIGAQQRGGVSVRYVNREQALSSETYLLTDFDGTLQGPAGTAVPSTPNFTVGSGLSKFSYYKVGDVVKLVTSSTEEIKQILSIGPGAGQVVFTTNVTSSGSAALLHIASTQGDSIDPTQEYKRYSPTDFGLGITNGPITDFSTPTSATQNRMFTMEDGCTTMAGQQLSFTNVNVESTNYALYLPNSSSTLFIRALCSRMDILVPNLSPCTMNVSVDGCPPFAVSIAGVGLQRVTLLVNARYQTHEITITNSAGLTVSGIILHEPAISPAIQGAALGTQNLLARYAAGNNPDGTIIPIGAVALDPTTTEGRFYSGSGLGNTWTDVQDFVNAPATGRYISSNQAGSYFEYEFFGDGFEIEFSCGPDRGQALIELNGLVANSTNYSATFRNVNATTGVVDMYSSTVSRQRFGISSLTYGKFTLRVSVQNPAQKNSASSGYNINIATIYLLNTSGYNSVTPLQDYSQEFVIGQETVRDSRQFESGATAPITLTQVQQVLAYPRDGSYSVGFESDDDFPVLPDGSNGGAQIIAALAAAAATPDSLDPRTIRKIWIKPGTYQITSLIQVPTSIEIEGIGFPVLNNNGAGSTCFQATGTQIRIRSLDFSGFTIAVDVNNNTGISMFFNRNMTHANMLLADTIVTPTDAQAVVGTTASLQAGFATHTDLQAAHDAVPAGSKIILLAGTNITNPVTISKNNILIEGMGNAAVVNTTITITSNNCMVKYLRCAGTAPSLVVSGNYNILKEIWIPSTGGISDSGVDNVYEVIQEL
jgi:hypothetical protein